MLDCALFPSLPLTTGRAVSVSPSTGGPLVPWPGPPAAALLPGELVLSSRTPTPTTVIVRAVGEIDLATAPALTRMLTAGSRILGDPPRHAAGPAAPQLVCDLSVVTFFAASGLSALVEGADDAARRGVELCVVAPHRIVRRPLELSGVARRLRLEHSLAAADAGRHRLDEHDQDSNEDRLR